MSILDCPNCKQICQSFWTTSDCHDHLQFVILNKMWDETLLLKAGWTPVTYFDARSLWWTPGCHQASRNSAVSMCCVIVIPCISLSLHVSKCNVYSTKHLSIHLYVYVFLCRLFLVKINLYLNDMLYLDLWRLEHNYSWNF